MKKAILVYKTDLFEIVTDFDDFEPILKLRSVATK